MKRHGTDSIQSAINLFGCFLIMATSSFVGRGMGVIYAAYIDTTQAERVEASWIFTLQLVAPILTGPLTVFLSGRLSVRAIASLGILVNTIGSAACYFSLDVYLFMIFNVIQGIGMILAVSLLSSVTVSDFIRFRCRAIGVATSAYSIGGLLAPLINFLIEKYALRGAFLIMSGIVLNGFVGCMLIVQPNKRPEYHSTSRRDSIALKYKTQSEQVADPGTPSNLAERTAGITKDQNTNKSLNRGKCLQVKNLFLMRGFHLANFVLVISSLVQNIILLVIVDDVRIKGYTMAVSANILTFYFGSNLFGRLTVNWVLDKNYLGKPMYLILSCGVSAVVVFVYSCVAEYSALAFLTIILGVLLGNLNPMSKIILSEYLVKEDVVVALPIMDMFTGLNTPIRGLAMEILYDETTHYNKIFYFVSAIFLLCSLVWIAEWLWKKRIEGE